MKITDIETTLIGAPLGQPFLAGTYRKATTKDTIITRVHTDADVTDVSFVGDVPELGRSIINIIQQQLKKEVIGEHS